jgi:hypothetical protein
MISIANTIDVIVKHNHDEDDEYDDGDEDGDDEDDTLTHDDTI